MTAAADLLVLGASGRVGRRLRRIWPQRDARVLWQYRRPAASPEEAPDIWQSSPGQPLPAARAVLVLSGITRGSPEALAANAALAEGAAVAIRQMGAERALFASTMAVYGDTRPGGACEQDLPRAPGPYGVAKRAAETAFLTALQGEAEVSVLRFGNVVGADLLGDAVAAGQRVRLDRFADGQGPRRSYLGLRQLARVLEVLVAPPILAASAPGATGGGATMPRVLNLAGAAPIAMEDLLRAAGLPFDWHPAPSTARAEVVMACDRLAAWVAPDPAEESPAGLARDLREGGP